MSDSRVLEEALNESREIRLDPLDKDGNWFDLPLFGLWRELSGNQEISKIIFRTSGDVDECFDVFVVPVLSTELTPEPTDSEPIDLISREFLRSNLIEWIKLGIQIDTDREHEHK